MSKATFIGFGPLTSSGSGAKVVGDIFGVVSSKNEVAFSERAIDWLGGKYRRRSSFCLLTRLHQRHLQLPTLSESISIEKTERDMHSKVNVKEWTAGFFEVCGKHFQDQWVMPRSWVQEPSTNPAWIFGESNVATTVQIPEDSRLIYVHNGLMVIEETESFRCLPAGPQWAYAWTFAHQAVERMIDAAGKDIKEAWEREFRETEGWFAYQQAAFRIMLAIKHGRSELNLGARNTPVFLSGGMPRSRDLCSMQITINLPSKQMDYFSWWRNVARTDGEYAIPWQEKSNLFLVAHKDDLGDLDTYMKSMTKNRIEYRTVGLADLELNRPPDVLPAVAPPVVDAPDLDTSDSIEAEPVVPRAPQHTESSDDEVIDDPPTESEPEPVRQESSAPEPSSRPETVSKEQQEPPPPADLPEPEDGFHAGGIPTFRCGQFVIYGRHRKNLDSMSVWVNDEASTEQTEGLKRMGKHGTDGSTYGLPSAVDHGSVLRVDYEFAEGVNR